MENLYSSISFVSSVNYNNIAKQNINLEVITKSYVVDDKLSKVTMAGIDYLNTLLRGLIFNTSPRPIPIGEDPTDSMEYKYSKDQLRADYEEFKKTSYLPSGKYYDLKMINGHDLVVVVDPCFIGVMLESKDELLKFILACLQIQYNYNICMRDLLSTLTKLKLDEGYYKVICLNVLNSL